MLVCGRTLTLAPSGALQSCPFVHLPSSIKQSKRRKMLSNVYSSTRTTMCLMMSMLKRRKVKRSSLRKSSSQLSHTTQNSNPNSHPTLSLNQNPKRRRLRTKLKLQSLMTSQSHHHRRSARGKDPSRFHLPNARSLENISGCLDLSTLGRSRIKIPPPRFTVLNVS